MKTILLVLPLFLISLAGCDDPSEKGNNTNQTSGPTNNPTSNINKPPDFMENPARVISVTDGDTVHVLWYNKNIKIRMLGVNTPEIAHNGQPAEPYGVEAMEYTKAHLPNSSWVGLEFDNPQCAWESPPASCYDMYDRLLAYLRTDQNQDHNAQLIINGLARVYTMADCGRKTYYLQLQEAAVDAKRGIWSE